MMMNDCQPKRPPRMTRPMNKDSSASLLMNTIRALTQSRDPDDRDREEARLESQYQKTDALLDALIENHHADLMSAMNIYSSVSNDLKKESELLRKLIESSESARDLLRLDLGELRKLLLEILETKHVSEMLEEYDNVSRVPEQINELTGKKHYLHATKLLIKSIDTLETDLQPVESLKTVKSDLLAKKEQMYSMMIDELHRHVYVRCSGNILKKFKRTASERRHANVDGQDPPSRKVSVADLLSPALIQNTGQPKRRSPNFTSQNDLNLEREIIENPNEQDPESDTRHFIAIIIECLCLLKKIPDTVRAISERTEKELSNIVQRTARELIGASPSKNQASVIKFLDGPVAVSSRCTHILENDSHPAYLLYELCELLFQQFRSVVTMHETTVIPYLKKAACRNSQLESSITFYNVGDIWAKVQSVLEKEVIEKYLDFNGTSYNERQMVMSSQKNKSIAQATATQADLNSYFPSKRRPIGGSSNRMRNIPLFKFDASSHAISLNAYLQEQKEAMKEKADRNGSNALDSIDISLSETDQYLVCDPAPENIVVIFGSIKKIAAEIDLELNQQADYCCLHRKLTYYVDLFIIQVKNERRLVQDAAQKSLDAWRIISETDLQNKRSQNRPILHSVLMIEKACRDLVNLAYALPNYGEDFINSLSHLLTNYKDICSNAYKEIVQPESEDKRVISATWAKDADINRFLKDLPNWPSSQRASKTNPTKSLASIGTSMTFDESPEVIRLRNKKESEILTSNLAQDTLIPVHEILSDLNQMKSLGQLQESIEWLSNQIFNLTTSLSKNQSDTSGNLLTVNHSQAAPAKIVQDVSVAALNNLSREFEELAETCLLVLHLEVRVHCFYYLLRVPRGNFSPGIDAQEPDNEVIQLNKDLSNIDEALSMSIQPWKLKYVFEGVSHLVATILINSSSTIDRINANGVKRMCRNIFAIQQTLTSITMSREVALDYARQYFELFYASPEEILNRIEERGPQFQAQEYLNALELLHRSHPGRDDSKLKALKLRLDEILNEVAVSV
ncbi:exocyst complex component secretory 8 [Brevipalpus obovatus]|uniref:exocyst complex component secretory 8 n=1 Tax=Brevipalpus obovatus TaxID=246614 RepID=UPI003D9DDA14